MTYDNTRARRRMALAAALAVSGACWAATDIASPAASTPLREPAVIASHDGVLRATLVAERRAVQVAGRNVWANVYNGSFVGPTLLVRAGDLMHVRLVNHLREPTNLHFHGLHISPARDADNVFVSVPPGGAHDYSFRLPADAFSGTYWYHSHADMTSEAQVFAGLSGVLEVAGLSARLPAGLQGVAERVLALKDFQVANGAIVSDHIDSNAPTTRTVDGQLDPALTVAPGETQLWHLANIGADIFYYLRLDGHRFRVIGQDGNPVVRTWTSPTLVLPPGKRFDVLVRGGAPGIARLRTLAYNQGGDHYPERTLATLRTAGPARTTVAAPVDLAPAPDLRRQPAARTRRFVFSENRGDSGFFINGRPYDRRRVDVRARLNTVEQWTLDNHTEEQHPFHLHTYRMQVISVNGRPRRFLGYQDEVILPIRGRVVVRIAFRDFTGLTVFHCHILAHEDQGMMANLEVRG
jgi:FtsP/CotA-like multicopper oxidase with cupredoxin domain